MSQAIAAVGQIQLAKEFQNILVKNNMKMGQILISPDDTEQRKRAINVRRTFENLFKLNAIPLVNENDTTATSEIKYGDNDRLGGEKVAQIVGADTLIIFSDVDGLYDKKSKSYIKQVESLSQKFYKLADKKNSAYGAGGMITKLDAAKICMDSGCYMFIGNGKYKNPLQRLIKEKKTYMFHSKNFKFRREKKMDSKLTVFF